MPTHPQESDPICRNPGCPFMALTGAEECFEHLSDPDSFLSGIEKAAAGDRSFDRPRWPKLIADGVAWKSLQAPGADLRGSWLEGADLSGADLRGASLEGAVLRGACLQGADLSGADLGGMRAQEADFGGARLGGSRGDHIDLSGALLDGADFSQARWPRARLAGISARGATGVRWYAPWVDLTSADLSGSDLGFAVLGGGCLVDANFHNAVLEQASLVGVDARRARFEGARMFYSRPGAGEFGGADFRGADLTRAIFREADLRGADLSDARTEGAVFQRARRD